jgi:hypothetical protein
MHVINVNILLTIFWERTVKQRSAYDLWDRLAYKSNMRSDPSDCDVTPVISMVVSAVSEWSKRPQRKYLWLWNVTSHQDQVKSNRDYDS